MRILAAVFSATVLVPGPDDAMTSPRSLPIKQTLPTHVIKTHESIIAPRVSHLFSASATHHLLNKSPEKGPE